MSDKECEKIGCPLKGYWVEELPNGEKIICFKVMHNGERHIKKVNITKIIKESG